MTLGAATIPVISSIETVGGDYAAWLVDIWGVMHNGVHAYAPAVEATRRFREQGGIVVLLSNSPRPTESLKRQLEAVGVTAESYDTTVSSGDLTRHELAKRKGARIFHLGPERDLPIFSGLDLTLAEPSEAELVVCTGLFDDETETPEDYDGLLRGLTARDLPMLCANPDHMVERGPALIFCAGALAEVYGELGGSVIYAGKPYPPIYELAFETVARVAGKTVPKDAILAIGDGVHTDMMGAANFGLDTVFVASGLHMAKTPGHDTIEDLLLAELFEGLPPPVAAMKQLAW
jgi:HAD superfamily hydrolase (TIGR01459 family)